MSVYKDFSLNYNTFNELICALEKLSQQALDFEETNAYFNLIENLNNQKDKYLAEKR